MIPTTNPNPSTAHPPQRRRYPRWQSQGQLAQLAQSSAGTVLGDIVDIGLDGFQVSLFQPVAPVKPVDLLLTFEPSSETPQSMAVNASRVWMKSTETTGTWSAGFHIDELKPTVAVRILRHIAAHKNDYSVVLEDPEGTTERRPTL